MYCGAYLPIVWPSERCRPRRIIVSRTLQPPSCSTRATKAVLVDSAVASMSEMLPPLNGVSLRTFHVSPGPQLAVPPGHSLGVYVALLSPPAALAVEPNWNPPDPPYFLSRAQLIPVSPPASLVTE